MSFEIVTHVTRGSSAFPAGAVRLSVYRMRRHDMLSIRIGAAIAVQMGWHAMMVAGGRDLRASIEAGVGSDWGRIRISRAAGGTNFVVSANRNGRRAVTASSPPISMRIVLAHQVPAAIDLDALREAGPVDIAPIEVIPRGSGVGDPGMPYFVLRLPRRIVRDDPAPGRAADRHG